MIRVCKISRACVLLLNVGEDFGDAEEPHEQGDQTHAIPQNQQAKIEPGFCGDHIHPHKAQADPQGGHEQRFEDGAPAQIGNDGKAEAHDGKVFGETKLQGDIGQRNRQEHEADHAQGSGDKRAESGNPQGRTRSSLPGHLVSVDAGYDRSRFPGNVHQDGGGRSPIHRPVIDSGQHDNRRNRGNAKGGGQEQSDGGSRPDPGKNPDECSQEDSYKTIQKIDGRKADLEPLIKVGQ